ncbi:hypothetical protein Tco_0491479 [Tanacetum coccineum]
MNLHELQEGSKEWDDQREVVEELLEEEMLVSLSNHWLMVMWRKLVIWSFGSFGNGSSSRCHGYLWWLIMDKEDDEVVGFSKICSELLGKVSEDRFDGAGFKSTVQFEDLTDLSSVSRKIGVIWSLVRWEYAKMMQGYYVDRIEKSA